MSFFEQINIIPSDSPAIDAFGRQRVSEPATLFDGKTLSDNGPTKFDDQEVSGSGTSSTFDSNAASVTLGVSATTTGRRVRQSLRRFNYLPGKSQLVLATFSMSAAAAGVTQGIGYYDDQNGLFLRQTGSGLEFVRRTYTTGSAVDNTVAQANWNLDTLDGSGPSGITLDVTKTNILVIDFEWLGVGRVRMGFNINGKTYYCHEFRNANNLTVVYMSNPNLPIRYEIENDGTGAASTLQCICCTVMSEGGQNPIGQPFGIANSQLISNLDGGTRYTLLALRLKSTHLNQAIVVPTIISIIGETNNDAYAWEIVSNPTIAGTVSYTGVANSAIEWHDAIDNTNTVTGGTILAAGVGFSRSGNIQLSSQDNVQPGVNIAGTPEAIAVVVRPYENNLSMAAGFTWRELA